MSAIYHYCSQETFINIIKYKKLWLGDIEHMNDFMEKKWFIDVFREIIIENKNEQIYKGIYDNIIENHKFTKVFMCCLSKSGDSLSQWRAYAQDGSGVAIGLNQENLGINNRPLANNVLVENSFFLNEVKYKDKDKIKEIISELLEKNKDYLDFFSQKNRCFDDLTNEQKSKLANFSRAIIHMNIHTKNPAFHEENEIRLIYNSFPENITYKSKENKKHRSFINSKNFRISNGHLTSYYEFPIPDGCISKIILGPKNKFDIDDVKGFLIKNKINENVEIKRSTASYR
ncbi:DUF2971 domain-containing protein [Pectobacterium brasiliense]|uniref:DUF2971 domain-containing protein n=1 Tax=Pectobacterium brasiliense TaxID=180957 RepID=UPI0019692965|nr:DUF2971 domain-containing protein [Pectobacterium brasiliense]MBN3066544.1 DUF2971 domain-containing protein [Pectobacterium brasiliense]MBN3245906.1 DUF2971 domain-containing protein [Pectobacterium brasiliense]